MVTKPPKRDPNKKKQQSLDKDSRSNDEYPHTFRKNWPKKKSHAQRVHRRKTKELLQAAEPDNAQDAALSIRIEEVRKWEGSAHTLKERIQERKKAHAKRTKKQ